MSEDASVESVAVQFPQEMSDPVTGEIIDQKQLAEQLLARATAQNIDLVGPRWFSQRAREDRNHRNRAG